MKEERTTLTALKSDRDKLEKLADEHGRSMTMEFHEVLKEWEELKATVELRAT